MTREETARQIADARAALGRARDELAESIRRDVAAFRKKAVDSA